MSRRLDDLHPDFRPLADAFLARLMEAKLPVLIFSTGRSAEEQARYREDGKSTVERSLHQDGLAMDVVIYDLWDRQGGMSLQWKRVPQYAEIGSIAEDCGLVWGGRWTTLNDPYHVEHPDGWQIAAAMRGETS
jgi:uncharacterized protein YcbK (DUF882 family)